MDFKSAEQLMNVCFLFKEHSMLMIGKNGIGKTEMIKEEFAGFRKSSELVNNIIDFGGLRQEVARMYQSKKHTIAIADMQIILNRKPQIRASTLGMMTSLMSEGYSHDAGFTKEPLPEIKKGYKINFIMAGTANHIMHLVNMHQFDFMSRIIIIPVERDMKKFNKDSFKLEEPLHRKFDKEIYSNYKNVKFRNLGPRHNVVINNLIRDMNSLGIDGKEYILKNNPFVFEPREIDSNMRIEDLIRKGLKQVNIEEENDSENDEFSTENKEQISVSFGPLENEEIAHDEASKI